MSKSCFDWKTIFLDFFNIWEKFILQDKNIILTEKKMKRLIDDDFTLILIEL